MVEAPVTRQRSRLNQRSRERLVRSPGVTTAEFGPPLLPEAHTAIVFIPGVFLDANSPSVARVAGAFAESFGIYTRALTVSLSHKDKDSAVKEAEVIKAYLKNFAATTKIKRFFVVGMSYGGSVAMSVAAGNEQVPEFDVAGLVLINPRGADQKSKLRLLVGATRDGMMTGLEAAIHPKKQKGRRKIIKQYLRDSIQGALNDRRYKQLSATVAACVPVNLDVRNITAPVYLVTGGRDHVSHQRNIIPERTFRLQPDRRVEYLRRNLLPNANGVMMDVVAKGRHAFALFEPQKVADMAKQAMDQMGAFTQRRRLS